MQIASPVYCLPFAVYYMRWGGGMSKLGRWLDRVFGGHPHLPPVTLEAVWKATADGHLNLRDVVRWIRQEYEMAAREEIARFGQQAGRDVPAREAISITLDVVERKMFGEIAGG